MADFNSKYSGEQIEHLLENAAGGGGTQGPQGPEGPKGDDGVGIASVVQTTTSTADGGNNVVTVTLSDGKTSTFNVKNGSKGSQGEQGPKGDKGDKGDTGTAGANGTNGKDGTDGATFTPSVDANGNLSWTNNKGLSNPPTVNIKGPKGDKGDAGSGENYAGNYPIVAANSADMSLQPNTYYKLNRITANDYVAISELKQGNSAIVNEYLFEVSVVESAWAAGDCASLIIPEGIIWANNEFPPMTVGKTYIISIVNNLAVYAEF